MVRSIFVISFKLGIFDANWTQTKKFNILILYDMIFSES